MASPMCATCLTQDRWLKPLQAFVPEKYATSWMKYGITPETLVCWECEANILRVARFTAQVVRAQAMLQNLQSNQIQKLKTVLTLRSMSKLAIRSTIQVNTDQIVGKDDDCTVLSDDEDTNITQNENNKKLPSPETSQVTRNAENSQKRPIYVINRQNSLTAPKIQPTIKVKGFATNTPVTSNASKLKNNQFNFQANNSVTDGDKFIFVPENYGDTSSLVALIPGQSLLSNSAIIEGVQLTNVPDLISIVGVPKPTHELNMSDLIQEIKTDFDIAEYPLVPQNTVNRNTDNGIKIDNVMSLNPNSNSRLDKFNITPVVTYNANVIKPLFKNNVVNKKRHKINEPTEQDVKTNVFTLTETPVAVISNPNPRNVSEDTLDFEDNIPVTKIISEDSLRNPKQKQKQPQVLVEAVPTITKPKVTEMSKEKVNLEKDPDKSDKSTSDTAEKQHTVYSKSFESYITNVLNKPIPPLPEGKKNKDKRLKPKPQERKSQAQKSLINVEEQSKYLLKLLNYTQVMEQRELNRQHRAYKSKHYKCELCIKGWALESDYKSHMERLHTSPEDLFMCEICSCRFTDRNKANDHFNKHFNVYACRVCTYAHYDLQEVKQHQCEPKPTKKKNINILHKESPVASLILDTDKLPKCPYCEGFFVDTEAIERHKPQCFANTEYNIVLDGGTISKNNQRVDSVVEIMDDSDAGSASTDLLVPRKKKKNMCSKIVSTAVQNCVHCGRIIFRSDMEAHMKRRHPELIRLKANFRKK